jgi:hypothetical protein
VIDGLQRVKDIRLYDRLFQQKKIQIQPSERAFDIFCFRFSIAARAPSGSPSPAPPPTCSYKKIASMRLLTLVRCRTKKTLAQDLFTLPSGLGGDVNFTDHSSAQEAGEDMGIDFIVFDLGLGNDAG